MFLLTEFTFEDIGLAERNEFEMCEEFIKVLTSLGFPFLGILEGGFAAYQNLAFELQSKVRMSRVIQSSKLIKTSKKNEQLIDEV